MVKIPDVVHNEVWDLKNDSQETFEKVDWSDCVASEVAEAVVHSLQLTVAEDAQNQTDASDSHTSENAMEGGDSDWTSDDHSLSCVLVSLQ